MTKEQVLAALDVTADGLTKPEAAARLQRYGGNVMTPGKSRTIWHTIWEQVANIITVILAVSCATLSLMPPANCMR